jgi:HEAT repeat protein
LATDGSYPAVWRTFYKDPCEEVRVAALQFLAQAAPAEEFFRLLIDALDDLQPQVRAEALRRLQDVPVAKALPLVLTHLSSPEAELQEVLVDYLAGLPDPALDEFLDGVLGAELDIAARSLLVRVLGRVRHRDAAPLLEAFLEESEPGVRRAAVESLAHVPGQKAAGLLAKCLEDPDVRVRLGALDAAVAIGTTEGLPLLRRALEDPVPEVRRVAILRLSRLAARAALDDFEVASRDADPRVRAAAIAALAIEGTQAIEEWIGAADMPVLAAALRDLGAAEELERRLASARPVDVRLGALRGLFLRDARLRAQGLAAARIDPSPRVQAVGRRLEEILGGWLADPQSAVYLTDTPLPPVTPAGAAGADADANAAPALPEPVAARRRRKE